LGARRRHALGVALNLASAVPYSTSGFYTRLIPLRGGGRSSLAISQPTRRAWAADPTGFECAFESQGAHRLRPLVAHCHLGLGQLYQRMGKHEEAQEHLTTATTMYREMGMTYWLEQAERETKER